MANKLINTLGEKRYSACKDQLLIAGAPDAGAIRAAGSSQQIAGSAWSGIGSGPTENIPEDSATIGLHPAVSSSAWRSEKRHTTRERALKRKNEIGRAPALGP